MPSTRDKVLSKGNGKFGSVASTPKGGTGIWGTTTKEKVVPKKTDIDLDFTDQDMMMMMMVIMMVVVMQQMFSPVAQSAQKYFTSQSFQGDVESKILYATNVVQYWDLVNQDPYTPLISVYLINRGVNGVYVAINAAQDWMTLLPGETRTISQIGADRRIELILYKCDPGLTSIIEAEGHF